MNGAQMPVHAAEEMEDDGFTILDLENIILTGTIVERQKDQQTAEAVVKVGLSGILYIITVYAT